MFYRAPARAIAAFSQRDESKSKGSPCGRAGISAGHHRDEIAIDAGRDDVLEPLAIQALSVPPASRTTKVADAGHVIAGAGPSSR
jgi:hypothetical protein